MARLDGPADKVVVTNAAALRAKYGASGLTAIRRALRTMVLADRDRGIETTIVDLATTRSLPSGASPVTVVNDHAATRAAIDAIHAVAGPDYLVLLGGPDVVCHVPLRNPMPAPDPDPDVPSDLPFACAAGTELDAAELIAPQRIVGRIADVTGVGGADAARAFARVIRTAARWVGSPSDHYRHHLTISTVRWQRSTGATAAALFGANPVMSLAPPAAAPWSSTSLTAPLHLVNLHGATADARWLGDPGFAPALSSSDVAGLDVPGTVVISECCNATELFDPVLAGGGEPVVNAYLTAGAYGVLGPSCISYGGRINPDAADVLCRYFGEELLAGASLGRALLQARQRYVLDQPVMTPIDLKTIAQFHLIGDPSIHPVIAPAIGSRAIRRRNLEAVGAVLARSTAVTSIEPRRRTPTTNVFDVIAGDLAAASPARRLRQSTRARRSEDGSVRVTVTESTDGPNGRERYRTVERKDHG